MRILSTLLMAFLATSIVATPALADVDSMPHTPNTTTPWGYGTSVVVGPERIQCINIMLSGARHTRMVRVATRSLIDSSNRVVGSDLAIVDTNGPHGPKCDLKTGRAVAATPIRLLPSSAVTSGVVGQDVEFCKNGIVHTVSMLGNGRVIESALSKEYKINVPCRATTSLASAR